MFIDKELKNIFYEHTLTDINLRREAAVVNVLS